jgi:hypothetical protein
MVDNPRPVVVPAPLKIGCEPLGHYASALLSRHPSHVLHAEPLEVAIRGPGRKLTP